MPNSRNDCFSITPQYAQGTHEKLTSERWAVLERGELDEPPLAGGLRSRGRCAGLFGGWLGRPEVHQVTLGRGAARGFKRSRPGDAVREPRYCDAEQDPTDPDREVPNRIRRVPDVPRERMEPVRDRGDRE